MTTVEHNDIFITYGDTLEMAIDLTDDDGEEYILSPDETVHLYVKKTPNSTKYAIEPVEITNNILLVSADIMRTLEMREYIYEIRVDGGHSHTPINGRLIITPGVK